jgi:ABC-type amino acid transport substrate-binding protein
MVFFPFPPFVHSDAEGRPIGTLVTLFTRMTRHLGVPATISEFPTQRARAMLIAGEADVMLTNNAAPELQGHILSSPEPIDRIVVKAFTLPGAPPIGGLEDLRGRTIVMQQRFTYGGIRQRLTDPSSAARLVGDAPDSASALRMLLAGRGEVLLQYDSVMAAAMAAAKPTVRPIGAILSLLPIHINVSRRSPDAAGLLDRLIAAHRAVAEQSTESEIVY